ncbi:MAG: hypothetical protein AVDCRST_MAG19-4654, partial [uncultured Thermomicrobiales bacterium]
WTTAASTTWPARSPAPPPVGACSAPSWPAPPPACS